MEAQSTKNVDVRGEQVVEPDGLTQDRHADGRGVTGSTKLRVAYADPPYPGCAHLYKDHPDYAGEVDHAELAVMLLMYDGWILHTSSPALYDVETHLRNAGHSGYRVMPWVKKFAAFKRNVSVAYAWEPCLVKPCRKPVVKPGMTYRDWIAEGITLKRGLTGAKPEKVCRYLFEVAGMEPGDDLHDMFPGTGAVTRAWESWRSQLTLSAEERAVVHFAEAMDIAETGWPV